jgi:uncharacterized membrane protein
MYNIRVSKIKKYQRFYKKKYIISKILKKSITFFTKKYTRIILKFLQ